METWIPWPWQAKGSLQIVCLWGTPDSPSGLGKVWFMQGLCKPEAAASLNHLVGRQPQPLQRREVAEDMKQEGLKQEASASCWRAARWSLPQTWGAGCPSCSAEWDSEHPPASPSCSPLSVAWPVAAALEEDSQLKTTLTQITFPFEEKRVRARPSSRKPLKMSIFLPFEMLAGSEDRVI